MDTKENDVLNDIEILDEEIKPVFEPESPALKEASGQDVVEPMMITELQRELKQSTSNENLTASIEPIEIENSDGNVEQEIEPSVEPAPITNAQPELKIDEELIHSSLENTMLLNKELLKAAAESTISDTKDEVKENKKGIIFIIMIFAFLIIFTALIPFILQMLEK